MSKIPFTVSARTARLIGRENVANAEGALIELVKNCYDADSENAIILIDNKKKELVIIDTGDGMDDKIITDQWMTIGTDDKLYNAVTKTGRIKSGAKGIGRFALDRLGEKCTMITFPKESVTKGWRWEVDWNNFEQKDLKGRNIKLNKVFADLSSIEGLYFKTLSSNLSSKELITILEDIDKREKITSGTALIINNLRDNWDDFNISRVYQTLELLNPPEGQNKIQIWLLSAEFPGKYGLVQNEEFLDYDYKLIADYKKNKQHKIDITIHRNEFDYSLIPSELFSYEDMLEFPFDRKTFKKEEFKFSRTFKELIKGFDDKLNLFNNIGDFKFTFYFLKNTMPGNEDRQKYYYKEFLGNRSKWIEKFGGIKLYRDNFRIRPYGEIDTFAYDWLSLGERHGQNPAGFSRKGSRVRANQVAGAVKFSRIDNPQLEDKSNREGIQESDSFELFKNLLLGIIKVQEDDRSTIGYNLYQLSKDLNKDEEAIEESESLANVNDEDDTNDSPEETKEKNKKLKKGVRAISRKLEEKEDELATSRAMASAGIMIASFSHEFHGIKNNLTSRIFLLKNKLDKVISEKELLVTPNGFALYNEIDKLHKQDQKIKQWIEFAIGLTKKDRRKNKQINIVDYFLSFKEVWNENLFKERGVDFQLKYEESLSTEFITNISELDLDTVFDNLITNSIEAFQRSGTKGDRRIKIELFLEEKFIKIKYLDNGPGINSEYKQINDIFKPFETSKTDDLGKPIGTGLGMWLVKSAIDSNKAKVALVKPPQGFEINFWFKKIK